MATILNVADAAAFLGVHPNSIRSYAKAGTIPAVKLGRGWRFIQDDLVAWMRELFGFPATASGLFVTGSSMANLVGLLVARTAALGGTAAAAENAAAVKIAAALFQGFPGQSGQTITVR